MWQPVMGVRLGPGGKSVPGRERERPRGVREQARKKVSGGAQRGGERWRACMILLISSLAITSSSSLTYLPHFSYKNMLCLFLSAGTSSPGPVSHCWKDACPSKSS